MPLIVEGRTIGVLVVQTYDPAQQYTDVDMRLLEFVGRHVGVGARAGRDIDARGSATSSSR